MHDPVEVHPDRSMPTPTPPPDALVSVEKLSVSTEPSPVSPFGFAVLSALLGLATVLAAGVVAAGIVFRHGLVLRSSAERA